MSAAVGPASAKRVRETAGRTASVLENERVRVLVDDEGGMVPEFCIRRGEGYINAHWIPEFRSNSGIPYDEASHSAFWKGELLYSIAGNFPCSPNFGSAETADGVEHPAHGWAAARKWTHEGAGVDSGTGAAWSRAELRSPDARFPISYRKLDAVFPGHCAHYASLEIANAGDEDIEINVAWHNTVGAPFLQEGCRISSSATRYATPPPGSEFDATGRLGIGAEFDDFAGAPLRSGGTCDLRRVPGPIGSTDFVVGAIPADAELGWSAVVNPVSRLVYACFFPGPATAEEDEIALSFNAFWMQYGGRPFTPWAAYEGGADRTFCLGTENITAAFGNGLAYSRGVRKVLGRPTTIRIPAGGKRTLRYGTLFAQYGAECLDGGVEAITAENGQLALRCRAAEERVPADAAFAGLKALEKA